MPISTSIPNSGFDLDSDYSNVPNGFYVDANDIKIKSDGTSNGYLIQNIEGNEFQFSIGDLQPQNKKFLIEQGTDGTSYTINLYDAYGTLLKTATNTVFATLITAFDAALAAGTPITYTKTTGTFNGKAQVSYVFTSIPYYDYKLENTGNQFGFLYVVKEIVDDSEAALGAKKIIKAVQGQNGVYLFSTNQAVQDSGNNVISVSGANVVTDAGKTKILTAGVTLPVGVSNGSYFRINIVGTVYNGIHIAKVNNDGSLTIVDLPFVSSTGFTYEFYISKYGEIGFVDFETKSYNLVYSTTQWDFTIFYPIDSRTEVSALGFDQIYFCSKIDRIRVFYAQTTDTYAYDTTFGLTLVPPYHILRGGNYDYETILVETLLQLQNTTSVTLETQTSGGTILAGNWRYAVSLITQNGSAESELTNPCNPINVDNFSPNNNYNDVYGNLSDTITDKSNVLTVSGITPNTYQYIVLYGFHYANGSTLSYRIKQQLIPSDATTATIIHYGTEIAETVAFNELQFSTNYYKAQNVELIDNRLTFSNVEQEGNIDFTEFAQSIKHNIQNQPINQLGEYKNPYNVCNEVGYMVNEDYVFAIQLELYSGVTTNQVYWVDTVRINYYESGGIPVNQGNPTDNRRVAGGTTNMQISDANGIRKIYPQFIIDWDNALINGVLARTIIKTVKFYRAEVVNPRVIACGLLVPCVRAQNPPIGGAYIGNDNVGASPYPDDIFAYPDFATSTAYPGNYRDDLDGGTQQNFAFYSPDYYYLGNNFTRLSGDQLIIASGLTKTPSTVNTPSEAANAYFSLILGDETTPVIDDNPFNVDVVTYCTTGTYVDIQDNHSSRFHNQLIKSLAGFQNYSCHVLTLDTNTDIVLDRLMGNAAYAYYIRPRSDQYGNLSLLKYNYTGCYQNEADCPPLTTTPAEVNKGGDTFNQYSALKQRVKTGTTVSSQKWNNAGVAFYTQNRINSQMRVKVGTNYNYYPNGVTTWLCNLEPEAINYDSGYNIYGNNYINTLTPYDVNIPNVTKYGSRAVWTNEKPAGSLVDDYRIIPPLNFYDFPMADGEITAHIKVNRVLYFLQPYRFSQKYFNSEGQFQTVSGDNIVLGENAVMSRREQDLSGFGSRHKESVQLGFSESGKEVLYWVCSDYKKIMRYGADGTVAISDRNRTKTWCERTIIDAFNINTNSCLGIGISAVWNSKDKEYIVTFKYGTNVEVPLTINTTIAFCEVTNKFTSYYSAHPTIYIPFKNVYMTPNSVYYGFYPSEYLSENTGDIYLHDDDTVDNVLKPTYYGTPTNSDVSVVSNQDPINNKLFQAYEVDFDFGGTNGTLGGFDDVLFSTKKQSEVSVDPNYSEVALDMLRGQIPVTGENNFTGLWTKCKLVFLNSAIGNLQRLTIKYITSNRYSSR